MYIEKSALTFLIKITVRLGNIEMKKSLMADESRLSPDRSKYTGKNNYFTGRVKHRFQSIRKG